MSINWSIKGIIAKVVLGIIMLQAFLFNTYAQEKSASGCKIINDSLHSISISYKTFKVVGEGNKKSKLVTLQLLNNTTCSIFIPTDRLISEISGGEILNIGFLTQEEKQKNEANEFYKWTDVRTFSRLDGGKYIFFTVPIEIFREKFFVIVPFYYEWDFPEDMSSITHRSYFYYRDVPSKIFAD